jgi:rare lipoprotein A
MLLSIFFMLGSKLKALLLSLTLPGLGLIPIPAFAQQQCSTVSYYGVGDGYGYQRTANGETFNPYGNTAAHRWLRFGTRVRLTNPDTGRSVTVRINDRGPFVSGREFDLSYGAFRALANPSRGVTRVCYSV